MMSSSKKSENRWARLKKITIFGHLDESELELLDPLFEEEISPEGTEIFTQGSIGATLYMIQSGQVRIYRRGKGKQEWIISDLKEGNFFGDLSFFDGKPRSASARALTEVQLLILRKESFEKLSSEAPATSWKMIVEMVKAISGRLREANEKFADHVRWGVDVRTLEERLREVMIKNEDVKIALASGGDVTGKIIYFDEDEKGLSGIRVRAKEKEYMFPYSSVVYITTRDRFGNL